MASPSPASAPAGAGRAGSTGAGVAAAMPALLGAVAEGAWIAIVAAAVVAPIGGPGPLGTLLPTVLAALLGFGAARLLPAGGGRAPALVGLAVGIVVVAWALGQELGLASTDGVRPVGMDVALGLAVLRGAAQGDPSAGAYAIESLVRRSPWLLGAAWAAGLVMAGEARSAFAADAAFASLAFVVSAALALGTSRMAALPPEVRHQLGGNGALLGMVGVVVGIAVLVSLPVAAFLGQPIGLAAGAIAGVATTAILGLAGAMVTAIMVVVDLFAGLLRGLIGMSQITPAPPPPETVPQRPLPPGAEDATGSSIVEPLIAIVVIVGLLALAWYLARRWQGARRSTAAGPDVPEERGIDLGRRPALPGLHLPRRLRSVFAPDDAQSAYRRLLVDWAATPELAREPTETPAGHAARLRAEGRGTPALDLLAADYQLADFGGIRLTRAEERRAIGRWRRLRGRAQRRPPPGRTGPPT